jgi:hypothetical protein
MEKIKFETLISIGICLFVLIIVGFIFLFTSIPKTSEEQAKFIGENSVLYTQLGCSHCEKQENMFGENAKYLKIIDCFEETEKCIEQKYEGVKTAEELENLIRS